MPDTMRDPIDEFLNFNRPFAQRHPELYRVKVARMAEGPFPFFRGTFHLYARDVIEKVCQPVPALLPVGLEMPLVGDIHSENYGTYKAADGTVCYDINDFDEATTGRVGFDLCRLATSLFLASRQRGDSLADATLLVLTAVQAYTESLPRFVKKGKSYAVSTTSPSACAAVDDVVRQASEVKRTEFIGKLTEKGKSGRRLVRSAHFFNLPDQERDQALRLLRDYAARRPEPPTKDFYQVEDACGRVAGIGSMGRLRYAVLVHGKGSAEARNLILEFKEARPTAYDIYRQRQTDAKAVAERAEAVIAAQRRAEAACNPHLGFAVDEGMSFQVRELGPHDIRLDFRTIKNVSMLQKVAAVQAAILARSHAQGASSAVGMVDPLADMNDPDVYAQRILCFALAYSDQVRQDWTKFVGNRADIEALH
ncbi:MAG: DUF2252 domain-containing protein [Gemmataceae bacterium]|nr:DUF2252 domain-containing protein [Gemmataceae bacterium]